MSLPTSVNGPKPVEGTANELTYVDIGASFCVVNGNNAGNTEVINACKKFLQFIYSDAELQAYTKLTGTNRALIEYPIENSVYEDMDNYMQSYQNVVKRASNAKVLYSVSDTATFLNSPTTFKMKKGGIPITTAKIGNKTYDSLLIAMRSVDASAADIFKATRMSTSDWNAYYTA